MTCTTYHYSNQIKQDETMGHMAQTAENRKAYRVLVKKLKERDNMEGIGVDGRIIVQWILSK